MAKEFSSALFNIVQPEFDDIQEVARSMEYGALPIIIKWLEIYQESIRSRNESRPEENSLDLSTSVLYRLGQCSVIKEIIQLPKVAEMAIMKLEKQTKV